MVPLNGGAIVCLNISGLLGVFATFCYFNQGYKGFFCAGFIGYMLLQSRSWEGKLSLPAAIGPQPQLHCTSGQDRAVSMHPVLPSSPNQKRRAPEEGGGTPRGPHLSRTFYTSSWQRLWTQKERRWKSYAGWGSAQLDGPLFNPNVVARQLGYLPY